jgi:hypothetical protein
MTRGRRGVADLSYHAMATATCPKHQDKISETGSGSMPTTVLRGGVDRPWNRRLSLRSQL